VTLLGDKVPFEGTGCEPGVTVMDTVQAFYLGSGRCEIGVEDLNSRLSLSTAPPIDENADCRFSQI
jgi:hypothetical protein